MTQDLNSFTVTGELADDPELRYTGNGTPVCNIRIKVTNVYQNNGEWDSSDKYFTMVAWGDKGEQIGNNMREGDRGRFSGELDINSWEDGNGNSRYDTVLKINKFGAETASGGGGSPQPDPQPEPADQRRAQGQSGGQQQRGGSNGRQERETFEPDDDLPF